MLWVELDISYIRIFAGEGVVSKGQFEAMIFTYKSKFETLIFAIRAVTTLMQSLRSFEGLDNRAYVRPLEVRCMTIEIAGYI